MSTSMIVKSVLGASAIGAAALISSDSSGGFVDLTISDPTPELVFNDTTAAAIDWEVETGGNGDFFQIGSLGGVERLRIFEGAGNNALVITDDSEVAINGATTHFTNELEVYGSGGVGDSFAAVSISPGGVNVESGRILVDDTSNAMALSVRPATGAYDRAIEVSLSNPGQGLVVDASGDVAVGGIGLTSVQDDFHVNGGQVKLDPSGTAGDWQLNPGGTGLWFINEDGSSTTPVKFNANAPTNSLVVEGSTGDIGLGTSSPTASLDIQTSDGSALFQVQNASTVAVRQMMNLRNTGGIRFSMDNTTTGDRWDFNNDGAGNFGISFVGTGVSEMRLFQNGNMQIEGTLNELSDRNSKRGFEAVDCDDVLERIASLPVTTWSYKSDDESVRHMGPVAQDFRAAFGLGENDVTIAVSDKIGVSLAGIQALNKKLESKDAKIVDLEEELKDVSERMERLEAALLDLSKGK